MRGALFLFGIIFTFIGLLPFIRKFVNIPFLPTEGLGYSIIVTSVGILATLVGLFGFQNVMKPKI